MTGERSEVRRCGRPTKAGTPCKAQLYGFDVVCKLHATPHDRELAEAYRRGREEGYEQGSELSSRSMKGQVEWLERRVRELEALLDEAKRYYELGGDQVVEVDGYAYRWRGEPALEVGDRVLLPENWLSRMKSGSGSFQGTVTKLGATFRGDLARIVGRAQ